jgi:hypothetical protein
VCVATACRHGLVRCRSELNCSELRAAANEFSMDASCASRDMSTTSFRKFILKKYVRRKKSTNHERSDDEHVGGCWAARGQSCHAICTLSCVAMRRLLAWAYRAHDDCIARLIRVGMTCRYCLKSSTCP